VKSAQWNAGRAGSRLEAPLGRWRSVQQEVHTGPTIIRASRFAQEQAGDGPIGRGALGRAFAMAGGEAGITGSTLHSFRRLRDQAC
jgi:hypothetical protein